jgi:hypothetical protein
VSTHPKCIITEGTTKNKWGSSEHSHRGSSGGDASEMYSRDVGFEVFTAVVLKSIFYSRDAWLGYGIDYSD